MRKMELNNWAGVMIEVAPAISWDGVYADPTPHFSVLYKKDGKVVGGCECYPLGSHFHDGLTPEMVVRVLWSHGYAVPEGTPVTFQESKEGRWIPKTGYYEGRLSPEWYRWKRVVAGNAARLP